MTAAPCRSLSPDLSAAPPWAVADSRPRLMISMSEAIRRARNSTLWEGSANAKAIWTKVYRLCRSAHGTDLSPVIFGGKLYLPPRLHPAFCEPRSRNRSTAEASKMPAHKRSRGLAKLRAIRDFEEFCRNGPGRRLGRTKGAVEFCRVNGPTYTFTDDGRTRTLSLKPRTLRTWQKKESDGGFDALCRDGRGGRTRFEPHPEMVALYREYRYGAKRRGPLACHELVACEARKRGLPWFNSDSACRAWDTRTLDRRALVFHYDGALKYAAKVGSYVEPDPESFAPMERWEADHTTLNLWLRTDDGRIVRPVLTNWLDWRSRYVLGQKLVLHGNIESIFEAFARGAKQLGMPARVYLDNGRDFKAEVYSGGRIKRTARRVSDAAAAVAEGLFSNLGIEAHYVQPYSPNSKARIERWYREVDKFNREFPSWCGPSPDRRPEVHKRLIAKAVPWDEYEARLDQWIQQYNNSPHSGEGMGGRTPAQVIALAERKRVPDNPELLEYMPWPRPVSVRRNGITIRAGGIGYGYGAFAPEVAGLPFGEKVQVAYRPSDLRHVLVWRMDGSFVGRAPLNERVDISVTTETSRRVHAEIKRERKRLREFAKNPFGHLRDPVQRALEAQAVRAAGRLADPPPNPPILVPVRTPFETPPPEAMRPRRVVDGDPVYEDVQRRMREWTNETEEAQAEPRVDIIGELAKRPRASG